MEDTEENISISMNGITMILVLVMTLLFLFINTRRRYGVPPGPRLLPVVGNLASLAGGHPLQKISELRNKYGDIFGLYIGTELVIFMDGYSIIHEALVKNGSLFARRPVSNFSKLMIKDTILVLANGPKWKEQRAFTSKSLRDLCFSRKGLHIDEKVHMELSFFIQQLKSYKDPVDLSGLLNHSLASVMYNILFGRPVDNADEFKSYLNLIDEGFKEFAINALFANCYPFLRFFPIDILGVKRNYKRGRLIENYLSKCYKENFDNFVDGDESCLIDFFITAMKDNEQFFKNNSFVKDNLWILLNDLMSAGSETIATTLKWLILGIITNSKWQSVLHKEVDDVIGRTQTPSVEDRKSMPCIEATILEGLRFGHAVPLSVPHAVAEDSNFRGFLIPKDTTILVNLASVLKDPKIFNEPESFAPERFLDQAHSRVVLPAEHIPFSLGPRSCLGESLARMELFLYMTTLLQTFEFKVASGDEIPSTEGVTGLTYHPKPFKVQIIQRQL